MIFSRNQIIESQIDEKLAISEARARREGQERSSGAVAVSKADLIAVEQQKAQARDRRTRRRRSTSMEIRAPHDGIFVLERDWRGDTAEASAISCGRASAVAEIPLLDTMEAEVFVLEVDGSGLAETTSRRRSSSRRDPTVVYTGKIRLVDKLAKPRVTGLPVQYFAVVIAARQDRPRR